MFGAAENRWHLPLKTFLPSFFGFAMNHSPIRVYTEGVLTARICKAPSKGSAPIVAPRRVVDLVIYGTWRLPPSKTRRKIAISDRNRRKNAGKSTFSSSDCLDWLWLLRFGPRVTLRLTLRLSSSLSGSLWLALWLSLAHSGSLAHSLALSGPVPGSLSGSL